MLTLLDFPYRASRKNFKFQSFGLILAICVAVSGIGCSSLTAGGSSTPQKVSVPIAISAQMPTGIIGSPYNTVIAVNGGVAPYKFYVRTGRLPVGLHLNSSSGTISGDPIAAGWFPFVISVFDSSGQSHGVHRFSISVHHAPVQVSISPATLSLASGATHQFTAQVTHTSNHAVAWSASAGTVTANGLFTAPKTTTSKQIAVVATSKQDPSKHASASITVNAPVVAATVLSITSSNLPEATEGTPYAAILSATGGTPPYHWNLSSGKLPAGFVFDATTGSVDGTTSQSGSFPVTVAVSDASGQSVSRALSLSVIAASTGSSMDGPAELPRVHVNSAMSDTPAPGATHLVKTSAELQSALNSAHCGDTISLQAGATFTGLFTFPAKPCDDSHWIVVRSSASDNALPPEGTRATPCYAGTGSLPARPALGCSATNNVFAKLAFSGTGSGPVAFASGANHYRLLGLEITRSTPKAVVFNLVSNANKGASDHIVIDRSWLHGTAQDETTRGVMLGGSTYFAIVDSFFSDFHCVAITGTCGDSQAIAGGLGNNTMGPYKIVNNFLESAGENILFGGGQAAGTPEDIEIRRNFFFKPLTWMKGAAGFIGGRDGNPFIVKNHLELKNGARVLVEGNVMQNNWGGFSQVGFALLLTPKNPGDCTVCMVRDVTVRFNKFSHVGAAMQIGNGLSDTGFAAQEGSHYSIHDLVFDDVFYAGCAGCDGIMFQLTTSPVAPAGLWLNDVSIRHVTVATDRAHAGWIIAGPVGQQNFVFDNSIVDSGNTANANAGGGATQCYYGKAVIQGVLDSCWSHYTFANNVIISSLRSQTWPTGNFSVPSGQAVGFVNWNGGVGGDYHLAASSPYKGKASDGTDPGADIDAVNAATAGAR